MPVPAPPLDPSSSAKLRALLLTRGNIGEAPVVCPALCWLLLPYPSPLPYPLLQYGPVRGRHAVCWALGPLSAALDSRRFLSRGLGICLSHLPKCLPSLQEPARLASDTQLSVWSLPFGRAPWPCHPKPTQSCIFLFVSLAECQLTRAGTRHLAYHLPGAGRSPGTAGPSKARGAGGKSGHVLVQNRGRLRARAHSAGQPGSVPCAQPR